MAPLILGLLALGVTCPAQLLTMEEAVARAVGAHPDITAARASRAIANFQVQAARALPVPEFRVTLNNFSVDPDLADLRNSLGLRWAPPRPRELSIKSSVARARQRTIDAEIRGVELRVAAAVREAYRRAALAEERAQLAGRSEDLRRSMLDVTRRQVAAGLKEAVEADMAELALADAVSLRYRAQAAAAAERWRLARLLDPSGGVAFTLSLESAAAPLADPAALVSRALRGRADLARTAASCEQAESTAELAANQRYPWVNGVQVTRRVGADAGRRGPWGFQVSVELPLFRSPAQAETRVARAVTGRCRLEEEALRVRIRHEVEEAAAQWESAREELTKLERLSTGPAANALARMRAALNEGRADRLDVLQAEARQVLLRDRWLERRLEITALEAQLELAAGL